MRPGLFPPVGLAAILAVAMAASAGGAGVTIPDVDRLREDALSRWPSLTSRTLRMTLFHEIDQLTGEHLRLLRATAVPLTVETNLETWVGSHAPGWTLRPQERALVAGLLLQTELLDGVLAARDPARAEALRASRRERVLRSESDRIFGDKRDDVFFYCYDMICDMEALQQALKGEAATRTASPAGIRGVREAESFLQANLARLATRAKQIP